MERLITDVKLLIEEKEKKINIEAQRLAMAKNEYESRFYACLNQPLRSNGGYEQSREMIFEYLFKSSEAAKDSFYNLLVTE